MKRFIAVCLVVGILVFCFFKFNVLELVSKWAAVIDGQTVAEVEIIEEEYFVFSPEFDSCYNSLDENQKEIYKKLYSVCEEMPTEHVKICSDYEKASRDITIAYRAVLNDHTEIFWMPDSYVLGRSKGLGFKKDISISFHYTNDEGKEMTYLVSKSERNKMRKVLEDTVASITAKTEEIEGQFNKEKFINDYICENTEYDSKDKFINTAYGCLVNKKALCEGYSRAFKLLCNKVGIECDLIVGKADGEGHMWNSVNIDGMHSYVDVTWNDKPEFPYLYFNITDEQLSFDHILSPLLTDMPEDEVKAGLSFNFVKRVCSYVGNNVYEKNGNILGDDFEREYGEKAAEIISKDFKNKAEKTEFLLKNDTIKNEFAKDEKVFIRNIQKYLEGIRINSYVFQRDILVVFFEKYGDVED